MNKKVINKCIILIVVMVASLFIKNSKIFGFAAYTGGGPVSGSAACTVNNCSDTDKNFYGIKITVKNKNSDGKLENVPNTPSYYLVNTNYKEKVAPNDSKYIKYDFPQSLKYPSDFSKYLSHQNLIEKNDKKEIRNIINAITNAGGNINMSSNTFLEIEPVLALAYRRKNLKTYQWVNAYFYGTPNEIVDEIYNSKNEDYTKIGMKPYISDISDIARAVIMVNNDYNSSWCSFYDEGNNLVRFKKYETNAAIPAKLKASCNLMLSRWNVLRNYYTSLVIDTNKATAAGVDGPYTETVNINQHSAYAFSQINSKSIYGKTLVSLAGVGHEFVIKKYDSDFKPIEGITFTIEGNEIKKECKTDSNGICGLDIKDGTYTITENKPSGDKYSSFKYSTDGGKNYTDKNFGESFEVVKSGMTNITVINNLVSQGECEKDLAEIREFYITAQQQDKKTVTMDRLLKLYRKYGSKYNKLLDFSGENFENAFCSVKKCGSNGSDSGNSCLKYDSNYKSNDYSCYTELKYTDAENPNLLYVCNTNFSFNNNLYGTKFNIESGRIIEGTNGVIGTGLLTKNCFAKEGNEISFDLDIIKSAKFYDKDLVYDIKQEINGETHDVNTNSVKVNTKYGEQSFSFGYEFRSSDGGILISTKSGEKGNLPFSIEFKDNYKTILSGYSTDGRPDEEQCEYNTVSKLNLEFRVIDTKKPFVDKNGLDRDTMKNWCFDLNKVNDTILYHDLVPPEGKDNYTTVDYGIINSIYRGRYEKSLIDFLGKENYYAIDGGDVYKDSSFNSIDLFVLGEYIRTSKSNSENPYSMGLLNSCKSDNDLVKEVITKAPNSYGLDSNNKKVTPKYKITLTPQLMEEIKATASENKITYDSFNLNCSVSCPGCEAANITDENKTICEACAKINEEGCSDKTLYEVGLFETKTSKLLTKLYDEGNGPLKINYSMKRNLKKSTESTE